MAKKATTKKTTRKTAKPKRTTKATASKKTAKKPATKKPDKQMSALDAAAKVLSASKQPLNTKSMIAEMESKGYWKSPGGKTPHATLYSAILREIQTKGKDARFKKVERGHFELA